MSTRSRLSYLRHGRRRAPADHILPSARRSDPANVQYVARITRDLRAT